MVHWMRKDTDSGLIGRGERENCVGELSCYAVYKVTVPRSETCIGFGYKDEQDYRRYRHERGMVEIVNRISSPDQP